jgi:hypothetical protein
MGLLYTQVYLSTALFQFRDPGEIEREGKYLNLRGLGIDVTKIGNGPGRGEASLTPA